MVKTVAWTKRAVKKLDEIISYFENEGEFAAAENVVKRLFDKIELLKKYPEAGRKAKKAKTIRYIRFDKHRVLFYRIRGSKLIIVTFYSQKMDPEKRPY